MKSPWSPTSQQATAPEAWQPQGLARSRPAVGLGRVGGEASQGSAQSKGLLARRAAGSSAAAGAPPHAGGLRSP